MAPGQCVRLWRGPPHSPSSGRERQSGSLPQEGRRPQADRGCPPLARTWQTLRSPLPSLKEKQKNITHFYIYICLNNVLDSVGWKDQVPGLGPPELRGLRGGPGTGTSRAPSLKLQNKRGSRKSALAIGISPGLLKYALLRLQGFPALLDELLGLSCLPKVRQGQVHKAQQQKPPRPTCLHSLHRVSSSQLPISSHPGDEGTVCGEQSQMPGGLELPGRTNVNIHIRECTCSVYDTPDPVLMCVRSFDSQGHGQDAHAPGCEACFHCCRERARS